MLMASKSEFRAVVSLLRRRRKNRYDSEMKSRSGVDSFMA